MAEAGTPFQLFRFWFAGNCFSTLVRAAVVTSTIRYWYLLRLRSQVSFLWVSQLFSFFLLYDYIFLPSPNIFFCFFSPLSPGWKSEVHETVRNDSISKGYPSREYRPASVRVVLLRRKGGERKSKEGVSVEIDRRSSCCWTASGHRLNKENRQPKLYRTGFFNSNYEKY